MNCLEKFNNQLHEFINAVIKIYPEFKEEVEQKYKFDDMKTDIYIQEIYTFCNCHEKLLLEKNPEFFTHSFIQGIDFMKIFNDEKQTENFKDIVWKYIYTLYIFAYEYTEDKDLQSIIHLSEENNKYSMFVSILNKFKEDFSDISKNLESMVDKNTNQLPDMFGGMIGSLAQELANEINTEELNLDNPAELLQNLMSGDSDNNDNQLMNIVKNVTEKIETKISDGSIDQDALFGEASKLMNNLGGGNDLMKNMFSHLQQNDSNNQTDIPPNIPDISQLMSQMNNSGNSPLNLPDIMNKLSDNMGIPEAERPDMNQLADMAKQLSQSSNPQLVELQARRERLRKKLEEKKKLLDSQ